MELTLSLSRARLGAGLIAALDALLLTTLCLPRIWNDRPERMALMTAIAALGLWQFILVLRDRRRPGPAIAIEPRFRRVHLLQFCFQNLAFLYVGVYFRECYAHYAEIAVQLAFALALDLTLAWTLRRAWYAGLSVFPIVMSINLFLWFDHEVFFVQLGMVAIGLFSKALLTWKRGGVTTHIFNPSGFPLAVVSALLLLSDHALLGRGLDFTAAYEMGPNTFEVFFLVSLLVNTQFHTVLMTGSAIVTLAVVDVAVNAATGHSLLTTPFTPQVFLGATLLFTDPATTPASNPGKVLAGTLYGLLVTASGILLHAIDQPGYFDKVLAVPFVNLAAPGIDRLVRRLEKPLSVLPAALRRFLNLHAVHVATWALFFVLYVPELKESRPALFLPPHWAKPSVEATRLYVQSRKLCQVDAAICKPFGLRSELNYWLR
jgi:hypothetical protein